MPISELYSTCNDLNNGYDDYLRENQIIRKVKSDQHYAIDPDGPLGVEPFMVRCEHENTISPSIGIFFVFFTLNFCFVFVQGEQFHLLCVLFPLNFISLCICTKEGTFYRYQYVLFFNFIFLCICANYCMSSFGNIVAVRIIM